MLTHVCLTSLVLFLSICMCAMCMGATCEYGFMWHVCAHVEVKARPWVLGHITHSDWPVTPRDFCRSVSPALELQVVYQSLRSLYSGKLSRLISLPRNLESATAPQGKRMSSTLRKYPTWSSTLSWLLSSPDGLNALMVCSDGLIGPDLELNLQPPGFCLISTHFWSELDSLSLLDPKQTRCPLQQSSSTWVWISHTSNLPQHKVHRFILNYF